MRDAQVSSFSLLIHESTRIYTNSFRIYTVESYNSMLNLWADWTSPLETKSIGECLLFEGKRVVAQIPLPAPLSGGCIPILSGCASPIINKFAVIRVDWRRLLRSIVVLCTFPLYEPLISIPRARPTGGFRYLYSHHS